MMKEQRKHSHDLETLAYQKYNTILEQRCEKKEVRKTISRN